MSEIDIDIVIGLLVTMVFSAFFSGMARLIAVCSARLEEVAVFED